ncbi:ADP compounds hydrolase NudE [Denitratimonas sp. CY0512]|uniref:ADP compounds hydrolase NudE n=1 Tax=Denitratimonas sp. CY0512 TaxID=3131940 RepID=UPI00309DE3E5
MSAELPKILARHELDFGGRFHVERLDLRFSNGVERTYERMAPRGRGAVIVVPMRDPDTMLLVREYACGPHRYELGLVKGRIDGEESPQQAAVRELKEEAGFGARRVTILRAMTLAPSYMGHQTWLVLAEDLYPERLPGDEPEELEVIPWRLDQLDQLMLREDCSEGRSLAAMFLVREYLALRARGELPPDAPQAQDLGA